MFERLTAALGLKNELPFDYVVVDEAQDVSVPQLRFLGAMAGDRENGLFFAGDLGSASSSNLSRGEKWGSISEAVLKPYASTTGRPIRSGRTQTVYWTPRLPTLTGTSKNDEAPSLCSTVPRP